MPQDKNRQFLDFEKPIRDLFEDIEKLRQTAEKSKVDLSDSISKLEAQVIERRREITSKLTPWQKVQLSRHPDRPYTKKYIDKIFTDFVELYGDRNVKDDKAMVGGFASLDGQTVMVIGQQKGSNTKMRQLRNFGMANPEGYRKALRLMKLAEKFNKPVITMIDTPGAYPGLEAEERGQGEAIARNIYEMIRLKVPVICVIIGEGASGGALGIGVGDRIFMLENAWYTVISPENCSSILWRSWDQKEKAADQLKLTPDHMLDFGLIDTIVPEPLGGAHWDYNEAAALLKPHLIRTIKELQQVTPETRVKNRIAKFGAMGFYDELDIAEPDSNSKDRSSEDHSAGNSATNHTNDNHSADHNATHHTNENHSNAAHATGEYASDNAGNVYPASNNSEENINTHNAGSYHGRMPGETPSHREIRSENAFQGRIYSQANNPDGQPHIAFQGRKTGGQE